MAPAMAFNTNALRLSICANYETTAKSTLIHLKVKFIFLTFIVGQNV